MYSKSINELRKAGKLEEALALANQALTEDADNIWNKRAAAWVYYTFLKKNAAENTYSEFKDFIIKLKALELSEEEELLFDNSAWQIGKIAYALARQSEQHFDRIKTLYELTKDFHFKKPSDAYSFLFKAFHKGFKDDATQYIKFVTWWNLDNFQSKDYLEDTFNDKKVMSIVEQGYINYSKSLLSIAQANSSEEIKQQISDFLPKLDSVIHNYPNYKYPSYFKAKLLLAIGSDENIFDAFLPFAKQKKNDFWVWELISDMFPNDNDIKFACYCKALSLRTPDDFLVKIRSKFAAMLIEKQLYNEAKTEIKKVIAVKEKNQQKINLQIKNWQEEVWYKQATDNKHNNDLYQKHLQKAEALLFSNIKEEVIVVEFVNKNKQILNFVKDKNKHGFFKYAGKLKSPTIGDLLKVRFDDNGQDNFYKVHTVERLSTDTESVALKRFDGQLKVISPKNFGFINDIFVTPQLIQQKQLTDGQTVTGKAILSFNKKKNQWGWKVIDIK